MSRKTKSILIIISIGIITWLVWFIHEMSGSTNLYIDGTDFSDLAKLFAILVIGIAIIGTTFIIGIIWAIGFVIEDIRYNKARAVYMQKNFFIIINNKLYFIGKNKISPEEICKAANIERETFNQLIRGYYSNEHVVFYKGNFIYDEALITESLKYLPEIKKVNNQFQLKIYYGMKDNKIKDICPFSYYYGRMTENNEIIRENFNLKNINYIEKN